MRVFTFIAKSQILVGLAYPAQLIGMVASNFIILIATFFLWHTTYRGINQVNGVTQQQMLTFAIVAVVLRRLYVTNVERTIYGRVRQGLVAMNFIRPYHPMLQWLAEDVGTAIGCMATEGIPLLVVSILVLKIPAPADAVSAALFAPSVLLSYGILWIMGALTGLVAFWFVETGTFADFKNALIAVLSGSIVPVWFWPKPLQRVSHWLPFEHTYQTPIGIYIGRITPAGALPALGIQAAWLLALFILLRLAWHGASKRLVVQGG